MEVKPEISQSGKFMGTWSLWSLKTQKPRKFSINGTRGQNKNESEVNQSTKDSKGLFGSVFKNYS